VLPSNLARNSQRISYTNLEEVYHRFDLRLNSEPFQIRPNMTYEKTLIKVLDKREASPEKEEHSIGELLVG
jgi:hypothetical protein